MRAQGCIFLLYLHRDGSVIGATLLHEANSPALAAANPELFAGALASMPDMNGDGAEELAVGCTTESLSRTLHPTEPTTLKEATLCLCCSMQPKLKEANLCLCFSMTAHRERGHPLPFAAA